MIIMNRCIRAGVWMALYCILLWWLLVSELSWLLIVRASCKLWKVNQFVQCCLHYDPNKYEPLLTNQSTVKHVTGLAHAWVLHWSLLIAWHQLSKLRSPQQCRFLTTRMRKIQRILLSSVAILTSSLSLESISLLIYCTAVGNDIPRKKKCRATCHWLKQWLIEVVNMNMLFCWKNDDWTTKNGRITLILA
jgi:hypothetical protein